MSGASRQLLRGTQTRQVRTPNAPGVRHTAYLLQEKQTLTGSGTRPLESSSC